VQNSSPRFLEILTLLTQHHVDFIVVGGVSALLHGAPVTTFDLDIVHARTPENIARLIAALTELEAIYRAQPDRQLRPTESHLSGEGNQLLMTRFGPLDVLGMIGKSRTWEDLRDRTTTLEIEPGIQILVLNLETLIAIKEELGFPKDQAMLPVLRQALKESQNPR
jgi:hypothetical protein